MPHSTEISRLLDLWNQGDEQALRDLMPLIVDDLRRMAGKQMAIEREDHTLQPTALVNEVYLKLIGKRTVSWRNRAQFFAFVARMMRRLLVDHARGRFTSKRGGGVPRLQLDDEMRIPELGKDPNLLALDDALRSLEDVDPRQGRIVEMRYFTGLTVEEIAEVEGISKTTVKREWRTAKLWLLEQLEAG
ncbi:MAG: sigma-70 family RNA polymerase sigma factor [Holophagales bacterium]|nr:sigma-70 family RNA polymerase sigma factor [Holophagales bacterium]